LAAKFGFVTTRTLKNHEGRGLTPIKRNTRSVGYLKQELLQFFGIADEPAKSASFPQRRQRAKA
jgi:hypothetical protein